MQLPVLPHRRDFMMTKRSNNRKKTQSNHNTGKAAFSQLLIALLFVGVIFCSACNASDQSKASEKDGKKDEKKDKKEKAMAGNAISGGIYEASGVIQIPGTDKILFVDDGRPEEVFLMQIDSAGQQVGDVKPIKTGAYVENPEGITFDGSYFYMVGAQSNPKKGAQNAIARFVFNPTAQTISGVEVINDLRTLLLQKVAELKGDAEMKGADGGLNIEGLAWDQQKQRLLLGLRSPIRNGQALILPLKLNDPKGAFTASNINFAESRLIQLPLGGQGVREIQYDDHLKSFLVISGAPENAEKGEFVLWQWDASSDKAQPARKMTMDSNMKPEGITGFRTEGQQFIFIMGDANRYMKFDYASLS
jgi:hypothetical protein